METFLRNSFNAHERSTAEQHTQTNSGLVAHRCWKQSQAHERNTAELFDITISIFWTTEHSIAIIAVEPISH
jgi:hypothetical protein